VGAKALRISEFGQNYGFPRFSHRPPLPFAPCTLHFAVNWFCVIVLLFFCYNGWSAKMGFMPFWQPSTLCFDAVSFHSCIVVSWRINLLSLSLPNMKFGTEEHTTQHAKYPLHCEGVKKPTKLKQ